MASLLDRFTHWVFRNRLLLLAVFTVLTAIMGWFASRVRVDASFNKSIPIDHPYIQTFIKHQADFGGANKVLIALAPKQGSIFTPAFLKNLKTATDEVFFLQGVDRAQVQSIFTPNVRYIEVVEDGFAGGTVVPAGYDLDKGDPLVIRDNVIKSGKLGLLVANDFSAALINAQLMEIDPTTGAKIDYARVAASLEDMRQRIERDSGGETTVHIIGFAKAMGDIGAGARGVLVYFGISILITSALIWSYAGRWKLAAAPILCSLIAVVWQLGGLTAMGYGIDPLSILVPFLIFAIGVSHGVQMVRAFRTEVFDGADGLEASKRAFRQLLVTGGVALLTDTFGFLTILVIDIQSIRELGISASFGVGIVIITNLFLLPILLSFLRLPPGYSEWVHARRARTDKLWAKIAGEMKPLPSLIIIVSCCLLGVWAWHKSQEIRIGDLHAGLPELRQDSRYNQDTALITSRFSIGVDVVSVIVEAAPNACVDHEVLALMDAFDAHISEVPGVKSTLSVAKAAKLVNSAWNEGSLKWRVLPHRQEALAQATAPIDTATGLINLDGSVMPVMIFLADHKAETLTLVTKSIKEWIAANPSGKARFRLAAGNAGVMAATNEVVEASQTPILLWVFGAVIALCLLTFRSLRAVLCIILPLAIVSWLAYALMVYLEIGLKTSTLPVVALGVGIGVDYGIYIFARLRSALKAGEYFEDAMFMAFKDTGSAVVFTGLTLTLGVGTWLFSDLKFQADMGILLMFMFLVNMLGAILMLPAMARWLYRHHTRKE